MELKPGIYRVVVCIQSKQLINNESFTIAVTFFGEDITLCIHRDLNQNSSTGKLGNKLHRIKVKILLRVVSPDDYNKLREAEVDRGMLWISLNRMRKKFISVRVVDNKLDDREYSLVRWIKIKQNYMDYFTQEVPVTNRTIEKQKDIILNCRDSIMNFNESRNTIASIQYSGNRVEQRVYISIGYLNNY
jgi:hypothetical protein